MPFVLSNDSREPVRDVVQRSGYSAASVETPASTFTRVIRALAWLGGAGASVGLAIGSIALVTELADYSLTNRFEPSHRTLLLALMGVGGLVGGVVGLVAAWNSYARLEQLSLRAGPLAVAGVVPVLCVIPAWRGHELTLMISVSLAALALEQLSARAVTVEPVFAWRRTRQAFAWLAQSEAAPVILLGLAISLSTTFFSLFTIDNHHALRTSSFDLGIEENILWNAGHFNGPPFRTTPLGAPYTHLGYHQTWISYLIGPFYRLWPRAEFLLVFQALGVAVAAIPLFLLGKRKLGAWWGLFLAVAYLVYGPLHGSIMYDFHYQPLGNVMMLSSVYCLLEKKWKTAALFVLLTLATREDMSLPLGVFAAALVLTGEQPLAGMIVGVVCAIHFLGLKMIIMPRFLNGASSYLHQYSGLLPAGEDGYGGILKTVVANPAFTLNSILDKEKFQYSLEILAPLAFLPFRRPTGWLLALPGFFFTLLSTNYQPLVSTAFQYTSYWTVFLFMGAVWALEPLSAQRRRAWLLPLTLASVVMSVHFGAIVKNQEARGSWQLHHFGLNEWEKGRYAIVQKLVAMIPADASVASSERLVPHISNRADAFSLRTGVQGAEWIFTANTGWDVERNAIQGALRGEYGIVARDGEFFIAKKGAPKDQNEAWLRDYGFPPP